MQRAGIPRPDREHELQRAQVGARAALAADPEVLQARQRRGVPAPADRELRVQQRQIHRLVLRRRLRHQLGRERIGGGAARQRVDELQPIHRDDGMRRVQPGGLLQRRERFGGRVEPLRLDPRALAPQRDGELAVDRRRPPGDLGERARRDIGRRVRAGERFELAQHRPERQRRILTGQLGGENGQRARRAVGLRGAVERLPPGACLFDRERGAAGTFGPAGQPAQRRRDDRGLLPARAREQQREQRAHVIGIGRERGLVTRERVGCRAAGDPPADAPAPPTGPRACGPRGPRRPGPRRPPPRRSRTLRPAPATARRAPAGAAGSTTSPPGTDSPQTPRVPPRARRPDPPPPPRAAPPRAASPRAGTVPWPPPPRSRTASDRRPRSSRPPPRSAAAPRRCRPDRTRPRRRARGRLPARSAGGAEPCGMLGGPGGAGRGGSSASPGSSSSSISTSSSSSPSGPDAIRCGRRSLSLPVDHRVNGHGPASTGMIPFRGVLCRICSFPSTSTAAPQPVRRCSRCRRDDARPTRRA